MKDTLARLHWRSNLTGKEGHGDWNLLANVESAKRLAEGQIRTDRQRADEIEHWIEVKPDA